MSLSLVFSTCPNDTFIFHAWVHNLLPDAPAVRVDYHDVDEANQLAAHGAADVVKVSYGALPWLLHDYRLLPCGGALGRGCGPLVVTRDRADLHGARVAVPGERTTAYLLFRLWAEAQELTSVDVLPFEQIMPAVRDGRYDAGLVIHEARFTYAGYGLTCMQDLGEWWEKETGAPIPLGAVVCRRSIDPRPVVDAIRASLRHAWADPDAGRDYVRSLAQEMDPSVIAAHIALYVTGFSLDLGAEGTAAVGELFSRSAAAGLTPPVAADRVL